MALTVATRNAMLDAIASLATHASLHTADPGGSGASEVTGGSPAYARKPITWAAAGSGSKTLTGSVTFDVPGSTTVGWFGLWNGLTGSTFAGGNALSASESYGAQGTYNLTVTVTLS